MFDDLGQSLAKNPVGQRVEHRRVGNHEPGLMEGADEVLAKGAVDTGFSADRAVDLCDYGGRNLDDRDTSVMDRGDESREIPNDATTKGEDGTLSI